MKRAEKFISKEEEQHEGKRVLHRYYELRDVEIFDEDFTLLFEYVMSDDVEKACECGLPITMDDDFVYLECDKVLTAIEIYKEELEEEGEVFDNVNLLRIKQVCEENKGYIIYF